MQILTKAKSFFKSKATCAALTCAAVMTSVSSVFAEYSTTGVGTQITEQFTGAAGELKTVLLSVIGIAMGIILIKIIFKNGVSFFKQGTSK